MIKRRGWKRFRQKSFSAAITITVSLIFLREWENKEGIQMTVARRQLTMQDMAL
jgi:hypothetical protein